MGYKGLFCHGNREQKGTGSSLYKVDGEDLTINPRQSGCFLATSSFWVKVDEYFRALCHTNINSLWFNMRPHGAGTCPNTSSMKLGAASCIHMLCSPHRAPFYSTVQKQCTYSPLYLALCLAVVVQDLASNGLHQLLTSHLEMEQANITQPADKGKKKL